jgi:hypothetical protein
MRDRVNQRRSAMSQTVRQMIIDSTRSQGSNPEQTRVMALSIPLPEPFLLDLVA